nr:hypothetical protein [Tanacetum cinerariifolium]
MVNATKDNFDDDDLVKFQELLLDAEKPLYEGCPDFTKLSAIVKLLNLKGKYGASDKFFTELLGLIKKMLPAGVDTYDVFKKDNFNLRIVVLWRINDYTALGTLCGCPYSGFKGCVVCGKDTNRVRLSASSKQSYGKGKGTNTKVSENQEDTRGKGGRIQKHKRNTTEEENSSSQVNRQNSAYWKKFNIWYRKLRYWRHNYVPHCIDFMHVEKNVVESLVRTLLHVPGKTKDGVNARLDLAELGVKPELFAMQEEDKTTLPPACYTLTNAEKETFCETLHNIRVPQGYCSNFYSLVNLKDRKLIGLKSHDYHMQILLFNSDSVTHRAGGVKRGNLGYTLVDLDNLGHKVDPFILASQARQVFYVKDQIDKKLSIVFKTPPKNYKDTYDEVDEEFSIVIHQHNDNILPCVNRRDLGNEYDYC